MARKKKIPVRTCLGCQEKQSKRELVRIVRTPESEIKLDPTGKANGRGTYVCPSEDCLEKALKKDKLKKALNTGVSEEEKEKIRTEWDQFQK
ncbi:RNase P modulator RnpM [Natranaerobius thermophilus]|uniref:YlxR domain-containing protein n=1 Tax=Natranaerobius thermophilus (strain ATCC BAA-1301 / DSM 18059 / JW/NM-WN-LF) TaxID=457570 RepID=B2A395_NATTJ|nr:YlxR family protein [Natranaerobius thermophilus]ACB85025.1 protein of unknown function DUF448 [Natranaerobius thermophilus JW/NM-WN-LF]